ncbi:uncharacterized protein LOC134765523 isoform X2 [Penaeus indicus]|uniref:uncharacterized protein LOC134765523 isoform X2 n=1 Tax=Penaeus indicus TaxID=29960 RepID=UPI00300CF61A
MVKFTRTFSSFRCSLLLVLILSAMLMILHSKYLRPGPVSLTSALVLTVPEPTTLQPSLRQDENVSSGRLSPSFEIHKISEVGEQLLHNNMNASSTAVNFETLVAQRFKDRREHLEEQCSALREILPIQVRRLFMNALFFVKKYNFFTCITPKVGSSTWKVHLLRMKGFSSKIRDPHDFNQHIALKFRKEKPEELLRSKRVTKVVTVRHPLSRLLSAFRNKLGGGAVLTPDPATTAGKGSTSTGGLTPGTASRAAPPTTTSSKWRPSTTTSTSSPKPRASGSSARTSGRTRVRPANRTPRISANTSRISPNTC